MYKDKPLLHKRQETHPADALKTIALDVTTRCNMNCAHCYAEPFSDKKMIPLEKLGKTLEEAYQMGVYHYVFLGGEPIADLPRLEKIINMVHPEETYINVVTNGWNMDSDMLHHLETLQVDGITFSLDSGIEAEHDAGRAPGSFKKIMKAIDLAKEVGFITAISTLVTHDSLHSEGFRKAYEFALHKNIRIETQIAMPVGRWEGRTDLMMTPEDSELLYQLHVASPMLPHGAKLAIRDIYKHEKQAHCPAGPHFLAITATGEILPCNFCQYSLGIAGEVSLNAVRNALLTSAWFQGKIHNCLVGENVEFYDSIIKPNLDKSKPLDAYSLFGLPVPA